MRLPGTPSALAGTVLVALALLAGLVGPRLAPFDPHLPLDPAAGAHLRPGSERILLSTDRGPRLATAVEKHGQTIRYRRLGEPEAISRDRLASEPRSVRFWLGTDRYGRDLLSRLAWGARVSLRVAILAGVLALLLGVLAGAAAALGPRLLDGLLMRTADGLLAFPRIFLVLAAAGLWPVGETVVIVVLGSTGWMEAARLTRTELQRLRGEPFVLAARASGIRPARILGRHLLPLAVPPILVLSALRVGDLILAEATLSFLGFGIRPPAASWGNLIADGQDVLASAWWVSTFPGLAIGLTVLGFTLLAEGWEEKAEGLKG